MLSDLIGSGTSGEFLFLASEGRLPLTIAIILALGVGGQWAANRLRIPSVLLLLTAGILVGPVFGIISPEEEFGEVLFPVVSLAVGLLLYEGGLGLKLDRLTAGRSVILRLVTIGALVTWLIGWGATQILFDVSTSSAALIGAILVVSGPTVVIPLLHLARPREPTGSILRWEGIVIDPVGATLAIVVLDATLNEESNFGEAALQIGITLGAGAVAGVVVAVLAITALYFHWIPDHLLNPAMLAAAIISFAAANLIAPEAGLMATTTLGVILANQHKVKSHQLTAFSEDVGHLILGTLFIVLGALVDLDDLVGVLPRALILIGILIIVARPLAVWISTLGAGLQRNDRYFLAWMAPRGIVAASVATVFAQTLIDEGHGEIPELVPVVFATVIVTVAVYGLSATYVARKTRVAKTEPNGVALVSNNLFAVDLADTLASKEIPVLVISSSTAVQRAALSRGLLAYDRPLDSHDLDLTLDGVGIKSAILLTDDENLASLAAHHLTEHLGRAHLFQVQPDDDDDDFELRGRCVFGDLTFQALSTGARASGFRVGNGEDLDPGELALFQVFDDHSFALVNGTPDPQDVVISVNPSAERKRRREDRTPSV